MNTVAPKIRMLSIRDGLAINRQCSCRVGGFVGRGVGQQIIAMKCDC